MLRKEIPFREYKVIDQVLRAVISGKCLQIPIDTPESLAKLIQRY
jgi:hypothetical protein